MTTNQPKLLPIVWENIKCLGITKKEFLVKKKELR